MQALVHWQIEALFGSIVSDILFEKVLPNNNGVFTVNAEYKRYWAEDLAAFGGIQTASACLVGLHVTAYALYLFPNEVGIGRFQPYGRYTFVNSVHFRRTR